MFQDLFNERKMSKKQIFTGKMQSKTMFFRVQRSPLDGEMAASVAFASMRSLRCSWNHPFPDGVRVFGYFPLTASFCSFCSLLRRFLRIKKSRPEKRPNPCAILPVKRSQNALRIFSACFVFFCLIVFSKNEVYEESNDQHTAPHFAEGPFDV